jgi:hypothetical protein
MKLQKIYLGTFLLAIFVRLCIIYFTPQANKLMDLSICRETGQLVINGINPYDYNDQKELRNYLRTDSVAFNEYTSRDQDSWNFQAGATLPMATLFFGGIEYFFPSYLAHRYICAFFDSLLAVLVLAIVLKKWKLISSSVINDQVSKKFQYYLPYIVGLSLAAISPVFLLHVTIIPEYKGVGLLLILSAFYFSDNSLKIYSILLSPLLLGFSISFIGLGIFIVPICFYNIYNNYSFKYLILYGLIAFLSSIIWLVPFLPELITMMNSRMSSVLNIPNHGSMYVIFYKMMSLESVRVLKNVLMFLFIGINIIGLINKRLNTAILSASLIYIFTCVYLVSGNLDRYNIAIIMVIIFLLYSRFYKMTFMLTLVYFLHGCFTILYTFITKHIRFDFDGYFILLFSLLYFIFLTYQTFKKKKYINEINY